MKTLELNQMENLKAGSCASDSIWAAVGVAGIAFAVLSNPVGWVAGAGAVISIFSGGGSVASLVINGDCF